MYKTHLKDAFPHGAVRLAGDWVPLPRVRPVEAVPGLAERSLRVILADGRNLVDVAFFCHGQHHAGARRLLLEMLPDSVFEFAEGMLGVGAAYNYLRRYYDGADPRLERLYAAV